MPNWFIGSLLFIGVGGILLLLSHFQEGAMIAQGIIISAILLVALADSQQFGSQLNSYVSQLNQAASQNKIGG